MFHPRSFSSIGLLLCALFIPTYGGVENGTTSVQELRIEGRYAEAAEVARTLFDARKKDASSAPWEIADAERLVQTLDEIARLPQPARNELAQTDRFLFELRARAERLVVGEELAAIERKVEVRTRTLGESHLETAELVLAAAPSITLAGDPGRAEARMRRVIEIRRAGLEPDHPGVVDALLVLAQQLTQHYQPQEAYELAAEALEMTRRRAGQNHPDVARALVLQAEVLKAEDSRSAIKLLDKALEIQRSVLGTDHLDFAATLASLGHAHRPDDQAAGERYLREALAIQRRHLGPASTTLADGLNALAETLRWLGEYHEAIEIYREAGEIYAKALGEDHYSFGMISNNIAQAYRSLGDYERARPLLEKAAALYSAAFGPSHGWTLTVRANVAQNESSLGNLELAERMLREILSEWQRNHESPATFIRYYLSGVLEKRGHYAEAEAIVRKQLDERVRQIGDENTVAVSRALETLGRLRASQGDLEQAEALFDRSSRAWEVARSSVGAGTRPATFMKSPYEYLAVARLERGEPDSAWQAVERARGRVLADLLISSGSGAEPAASFGRERVQSTLPDGTALVGWMDFRLHLKAPRFWAYVIRNAGPVKWVRLPSGDHETIKSLAEELRAFRSSIDSVADSTLGAGAAPSDEARRLWTTRFAPLEPYLKGVDHLVVIPSWPMGGFPLDALEDSSGRPLGDRFAVSYAVSATTHTWLAESAPRSEARARTALLLGDPPFRPEHLAESKTPATAAAYVETAAMRSVLRGDRKALDSLRRLPWSRNEVQEIAAGFAEPVVLLGAQATETELVRLASGKSLRQFDVIHLATHALMDNERPTRSGLVLSQVGSPGTTTIGRADGIITGSEIMEGWELNAELVTLSACRTALGRNIYGEGVVGLSYPFLKAGARSLLVSLWKVDDEAAAILMKRFYELWLGTGGEEGDRGLPKSRALAEAKRFLREYTEPSGARPYEHPFYWSAFVLVGDPR